MRSWISKRLGFAVSFAVLLLAGGCGQKEEGPADAFDNMDGLLINEVSPSPAIGKEGWIELYNPGTKAIRLKGLRLLLTTPEIIEERVATLAEGEIAAGGYYVISTDRVEFSIPMLRATFEEIGICDGEGFSLDCFSTRYDLNTTSRPVDGGSYARIPDVTGGWTITSTATPGEPNFKIVPHTLSSLVINEVCPSGKWIELYNAAAFEQNLEYLTIEATGGQLLCTAPAALLVGVGEHVALDCTGETGDFSDFTLYDNSGKRVTTFTASGLPSLPEGGSWCRLPDGTGSFRTTANPTRGTVNIVESNSVEGMVINEVSLAGWVEVCNSTLEQINASGLVLKSGSTTVGTKGAAVIPAGGKLVFDVNVTGNETFSLCAADGTVVSTFSKSDVRKDSRVASATTSWSRLPDGSGKWYTIPTPTKGEANYGIEEGNTIAIWVRRSDAMSCDIEELCKLGIGNIVVHEWALKDNGTTKVNNMCAEAHRLGMRVHFWLQCFWWNDETKWRLPVIDRNGSTPARYNQELFDEVIGRAKDYMNLDIDGIHFDYIRFGGTANKHNWPEDGITGIGAITEFCRQANVALKVKNPKIVLSAALMGEKAAQAYYGQDPEQMTQYIDVIMPMAYISSYNYSSTTNVSVANWFADRCQDGKQCWHGFSTYNSNTQGLSKTELLRDITNIKSSRVDGIALFRYGLGDIPDLTGMFAQ